MNEIIVKESESGIFWHGSLVAKLELHRGRSLIVWAGSNSFEVGSVIPEPIPIAAFICRFHRRQLHKPFTRIDFGTHPLARKKGQPKLVDGRTVVMYLIDLGVPLKTAVGVVNKALSVCGWPIIMS